jgi:hypothetical protein
MARARSIAAFTAAAAALSLSIASGGHSQGLSRRLGFEENSICAGQVPVNEPGLDLVCLAGRAGGHALVTRGVPVAFPEVVRNISSQIDGSRGALVQLAVGEGDTCPESAPATCFLEAWLTGGTTASLIATEGIPASLVLSEEVRSIALDCACGSTLPR